MMPVWKTSRPGVEAMTVAVMGCVVNGPGESKAANIGISLPGTGESPNCPVFVDGAHVTTLRGTYEELAAAFLWQTQFHAILDLGVNPVANRSRLLLHTGKILAAGC